MSQPLPPGTRLPAALLDAPFTTRAVAIHCPRLYVSAMALNPSTNAADSFFAAVCAAATASGKSWAEIELCFLVALRVVRATRGRWQDVVETAREMLLRDEGEG